METYNLNILNKVKGGETNNFNILNKVVGLETYNKPQHKLTTSIYSIRERGGNVQQTSIHSDRQRSGN